MSENSQLDADLNRPRVVETEAGRVEYIDPKDAIKLDEYRKKNAGKSALERIGVLRIVPAGKEERF